ncbi:hypothetical protein IMSAG013_00108 [Clostridiales bacterium]|nr:hypothetical protein IMSAG013_00108 [Clostridiales bacterium]
MSIDQNRRTLNQLDKELADFEKKLADVVRKEADKTKRINDTQKSITKNTSSSMLQSKLRQIQEYQNDLVKISNNKADINKKIADKRKKRSDTAIKLQKEEAEEGKKASREQQKIYDAYERRISDLNNQIAQTLIKKPTAPTSLYHDTHDMEEYDVFISHASEDKESFANALNSELKKAGIKVWYDAISITWGDSLRSKIDNGLKKSRYGIVIISRDYIKKGWTQYELDGLFQREMTDGKTILPIWHNITKQEVENFSPTLAGRLALNSASMTPIEIADELKKILRISDNEQEDQNNA